MTNATTLYQCKKLAKQIEPNAFNGIRYGHTQWVYYNYMVVFLFGTLTGIHDPIQLSVRTKINRNIIRNACNNLSEQGIWKDGVAYLDSDDENFWLEIVLCTMVAKGELKRVLVENKTAQDETPVVDIFKIQKERESKPYEFDRSFLTDNYFENKLINP